VVEVGELVGGWAYGKESNVGWGIRLRRSPRGTSKRERACGVNGWREGRRGEGLRRLGGGRSEVVGRGGGETSQMDRKYSGWCGGGGAVG